MRNFLLSILVAALVLGTLLAMAALRPASAHAMTPEECVMAADMFASVAKHRDDGETRAQMQTRLQTVYEQSQYGHHALDAGDLVRWEIYTDEIYARPDWDPAEVKKTIFERCTQSYRDRDQLVPNIELNDLQIMVVPGTAKETWDRCDALRPQGATSEPFDPKDPVSCMVLTYDPLTCHLFVPDEIDETQLKMEKLWCMHRADEHEQEEKDRT